MLKALQIPEVFDALSAEYDNAFTTTMLGQALRRRVWHVLAQHLSASDSVLELACGTGEDALWLSQRGVQVWATDGSQQMIEITNLKTADYPVQTRQLSLQQIIDGELHHWAPAVGFDGVLSNFGGLNVIGDWHRLAAVLSQHVRSGGKVVLVPMGPFCPWEFIWYGTHGQFSIARRRWQEMAHATVGDRVIPIYYPSHRQLCQAFDDWFRPLFVESLGLWLPPSYLGHWVDRWPQAFTALARLETHTARWTRGWGDHYIAVFERL